MQTYVASEFSENQFYSTTTVFKEDSSSKDNCTQLRALLPALKIANYALDLKCRGAAPNEGGSCAAESRDLARNVNSA